MIILFPMLTSKSVSNAVIPGICKTLEKFLLVYRLDDCLKYANLTGGVVSSTVATLGTMAVSAALKTSKRESEELNLEAGDHDMPPMRVTIKTGLMNPNTPRGRAMPTRTIIPQGQTQGQTQGQGFGKGKSSEELAYQVTKDLTKEFEVQMGTSVQDSMTIEPTYITVRKGNRETMLGIKVISFPVDTDQQIVKMMNVDLSLDIVEKMIYKYSRKLIRLFWSVARTLPIIKKFSGAIVPDPETSILFARTEHARNIFVLLNYSDFANDEVFNNAGAVKKLFKMGWTSFIVADDVNKRAIFCMNQFKGMCSAVPYPFLYATQSRDISRVYSDLDSIKKSASPFFHMSMPAKKIFSESIVYKKLEKYFSRD